MTQLQLAEKIGVSDKSVSKWENSRGLPTKEHYISFVAASSDGMQLVKLYPEGNAEARFKIRGVKRIFFYCNRDGLFSIDPVKGVDQPIWMKRMDVG